MIPQLTPLHVTVMPRGIPTRVHAGVLRACSTLADAWPQSRARAGEFEDLINGLVLDALTHLEPDTPIAWVRACLDCESARAGGQ